MLSDALSTLLHAAQGRFDLRARLFAALDAVRADRLLIRRLRQHDRVAVLNLHRVSPHANPFWPPLHPRVFEDLLRRLLHSFDIVGLNALDDTPSGARSKPRLVLSFDDGYQDFVEYALPILHRLRLPVNQNVIPECVESGLPPWNIRLYDFLHAAPRALIGEMDIPGFAVRLGGDDAHSKTRYGGALSRFLKTRSRADRASLWPHVQRAMDRVDSFDRVRMMSRGDVNDFGRQPGCLLGAHSFAHDSMGFETDEFFARDLDSCVTYFRDALGVDLTTYAFPNGSFRPSQLELLRARGVRSVLLVEEKIATRRSDPVPRLTIGGRTVSEAYMRSVGYGAKGVM